MSLSRFVCPRGQTICLSPGTNISYTQERGGTNISHTHEGGGTNIFDTQGGDKIFFVGGGGAYDDADEEMVVSKASKLSTGARILMGPEILVVT